MPLEEYRKKRKFNKTSEPEGRVEHSKKLPLFVVQKHDASRLHYDFRLEVGGVLVSWAVPKGPSLNPADKRLAMMTEDHPMSYATFEGTITEGNYGAGEVIVWDCGTYAANDTTDPEKIKKYMKSGLRRGDLKVVLQGERLRGGFALVQMKGRGERAWLLIKERDRYASAKKDITKEVKSVLSKKVLPRDKSA